VKTIISIGDFVDLYYRFGISNSNQFLSRLIPSSNTKRTTRAWDTTNGNIQTNWWSVPAVQRRWNRLITGDETTYYSEYLIKKYLSDKSNLRLLSPGCGTGDKELKFARFSNFSRIEAFDLSPRRINLAIQTAQRLGVTKIHYRVSDIESFDFGRDNYNVILFDSYLHHIKKLDEILNKIYNSLTDDGIFVINEYVGPNRFQWTEAQLKTANEALLKIPPTFRRRWGMKKIKSKIFRPGILRMILSDPSEAVKSENILSKVRELFKVLEEKPYGGNILHLTLKDISHNFNNDNGNSIQLLNELFEIEDKFLQNNCNSDFIFAVYSR
jgi:ubiquinone/menaquinone biosynthesis C-methylase UbiE